jgi:CRP/FNR family transcriptional regulator
MLDTVVLTARLRALVPAFADADGPVLERLLVGAQLARLDGGQFVFRTGDRCEVFLILLSGEVRVQLTSAAGREVTLYRIGPGGSCILTTSCLLSHEHYPAEAIAEAPVEALAIPLATFRDALDGSAWFRQLVFDGFSSRLTNVIRKIEELAFTSIDARLAAALLDYEHKQVDQLTHQDLAVELGTAREVISRHLKRFEAQGWVRLGRGHIAILDCARLEALAAPPLGD